MCSLHGIQYYALHTGSEVPAGYVAQAIHGFVEELVVNDDPEYQVQVLHVQTRMYHALLGAVKVPL